MTKHPLWQTTLFSQYLHNNLFDIQVIDELPSSNDYLLTALKQQTIHSPTCILALNQTHGRARQGKTWLSDTEQSLTFSVNYLFHLPLPLTTALPLVIALALCDVLNLLEVSEVKIKWPNDLLRQHKKLAGILVECANYTEDSCQLVIGVGINVGNNSTLQQSVDQPLENCSNASGIAPPREKLLALILNQLSLYLTQFEQSGFAHFKKRYLAHCVHYQASIELIMPNAA
jgi:BirA family biotin operon repressor/biotin-[acetyl-CoA-carboxylase] ligase